jgi:hypothetical protein
MTCPDRTTPAQIPWPIATFALLSGVQYIQKSHSQNIRTGNSRLYGGSLQAKYTAKNVDRIGFMTRVEYSNLNLTNQYLRCRIMLLNDAAFDKLASKIDQDENSRSSYWREQQTEFRFDRDSFSDVGQLEHSLLNKEFF